LGKESFRVVEEKEFGNIIITDVRFPEEANFVKDKGGYVINIVSDRSEKDEVHGKDHASETSLDSYIADFVVVNNADKQHLVKSAKDVIEFIKVSEKLKTGDNKNG
jgi:hypothetical protein